MHNIERFFSSEFFRRESFKEKGGEVWRQPILGPNVGKSCSQCCILKRNVGGG